MGRLAMGLAVLAMAGTAAAAEPQPTPAERAISRAEAQVAKAPARASGYAELAMACARRARETGDTAWYARAEEAVEEALRLEPGSVAALKARCWVLLGGHRFAAARDLARELQRRLPDDVQVYGFLADANAELGDYAAAEEAAQWMLDLRPGNVPGLTRAAYLRETFGDLEGAEDLMSQALVQMAPDEVEDRAWATTQIAHLRLARGRALDADRLAREALALFPNYHYALGVAAKARAELGRLDEAVDLMSRRARLAPHPENRFDLAMLLLRAGRTVEARDEIAAFVASARHEMEGEDNANRELVYYYADHGGDPAEALRIATREVGRRRDVATLEAHAWALHRAERAPEAREEIDRALATGARDARLYYHAGEIYRGACDPAAGEMLRRSLDLAPSSEVAPAARGSLAVIEESAGGSCAARGGQGESTINNKDAGRSRSQG